MSKPLDSRVFNLAANLYGIQKSITDSKGIIELPPATETDNGIMAVYPAIIQEAFALTMDKYRAHINTYNFKTRAENREILIYNDQFKESRSREPLTSEQATALAFFQSKYENEFARDYNEQAEIYNQKYGMIVKKRKIQLVKPPTELVFQNLLSLYNSQLMKRNEQYMRMHNSTRRPLQEFEINSQLVSKMKRNGILSLDLCKKTIRNHRQRLEECGVLCNYVFRGNRHAVQMHINPELLCVLDLKTSKIIDAKNQPVSLTKWKKLPDVDDNTGTNIKEYQRNADDNHPLDKEFAPLTGSNLFFYKNTTSKEENSPVPPPPAGVKILEIMPQMASNPTPPDQNPSADPPQAKAPALELSLSDRLAKTLVHPQELAERLAAHEFDSYKFIPIKYLEREAFTGTLTNEEFREVVLQDFFKGAADIWKRTTPFIGAWKIAINAYYDHKFISFRNMALNKSTIIADIEEMRWCVAYARRWFLKNEISPLFPNDYFDFKRQTKQEIGFEYVRTVTYKKHLKALAQSELRKKKAEAKAAERKARINYAKKCETEVKRFVKNQITMPQLLNYVEKNLPPEFMDKLPRILEKHLNGHRQI